MNKMYNKNRQVIDSEIAEEMAYIEKPFREGKIIQKLIFGRIKYKRQAR